MRKQQHRKSTLAALIMAVLAMSVVLAALLLLIWRPGTPPHSAVCGSGPEDGYTTSMERIDGILYVSCNPVIH